MPWVATATLSTGHSAAKWTVISVAGATPAALNGEQRVLDTTTTTIKFAASGVADGTASGTITVKLAPAGWVKAFAGTHKAAYRSANVAASGILARIADTGTYGYQLHGYQSLSDIDTGSGGFGGHWGLRHYSGSGNKPWFIVANDRFVFFGINYGYSGNYGYTVAAFGDIKSRKAVDPYRFLLRANYGSDGGSPTYASQSIAYCEAGSSYFTTLAKDYTGIGGSIAARIAPLTGAASGGWVSGGGAMPYPNGADFGLLLVPACVYEHPTFTLRGEVPGALYSPQAIGQFQIAPSYAVGTFLDDVPSLPERVLAVIPVADTSRSYPFFLDLIGPWGN